jgi:hypothetical protein
MPRREPVLEQPFDADDPRVQPTWPEARRRPEQADTYWLATVRPEGQPHAVFELRRKTVVGFSPARWGF